ncbi:transglutaminase family protein [Schlesneria sp. DSM 10557]|uniref:transglutaminase-like domain-containing protein n=1 Tax=Schlesneria sp. DSM 10557 TaxID=3044399 RepID=UPI0035A1D055
MPASFIRCTGRLFLLISLVACGPALTAFAADDAAAKANAKDESWQVIYLAGQRIGYSRSLVETVTHDGGEQVVKSTSNTFMAIKRFGQTLEMKQHLSTEETPDGDLRRFRFEMANPPAMSSITSGLINGKELSLSQEVNGKAKTTTQAWKEGVKSPTYQDRILKKNPLKPGETRTFETFVPEFAKVGTTTMKAHDTVETELLGGKSRKLFKVSVSNSLLPGFTMDSYLDDAGEAVKVSSKMLGSAMDIYVVSQEEALKTIEGAELDLAVNTLVKVKPLVKGHGTKRVVYRLSITDQNPQELIPSGETQTLKTTSPETAELTVISLPIPSPARAGTADAEYLESSQYLQRDDEGVQKHANRAAGDATDAGVIAQRMETYVRDKLSKKNFSTAMASAAEVARNLEGDCTEHAVLLAAMLRARQIPSRVVVGLVYADRLFAFGGHMWTEARLNDQWIPLDATLGQNGIGAAHIKLADSSLSDDGPAAMSGFAPLMNIIGNLKLEVISAE